MAQHQRAAIGIADQMQGQTRCAAARFAHRESRGSGPFRPGGVRQPRRHGSMAWHARRNGNEARFGIKLRQMAHAEGRIGQAMHQHHGAPGRGLRFKNKGSVPILGEAGRVERACRIIAIAGATIFRRQAIGDFLPDEIKGARFGRHVSGPIRRIQRCRIQFGRHLGMPGAQIRAVIDIPGAQRDTYRQQHRHQNQCLLAETLCPTHQHPAPPKERS